MIFFFFLPFQRESFCIMTASAFPKPVMSCFTLTQVVYNLQANNIHRASTLVGVQKGVVFLIQMCDYEVHEKHIME